jgi:hypothetical protein
MKKQKEAIAETLLAEKAAAEDKQLQVKLKRQTTRRLHAAAAAAAVAASGKEHRSAKRKIDDVSVTFTADSNDFKDSAKPQ